MSEEPPTAFAVPAAPIGSDLSRQIEREIAREPGEHVKCSRVFGDYYRCNFWSSAGGSFYENPSFDWNLSATHHICRSSFLLVTAQQNALDMKIVQRIG